MGYSLAGSAAHALASIVFRDLRFIRFLSDRLFAFRGEFSSMRLLARPEDLGGLAPDRLSGAQEVPEIIEISGTPGTGHQIQHPWAWALRAQSFAQPGRRFHFHRYNGSGMDSQLVGPY